jgi:hypothetical protein
LGRGVRGRGEDEDAFDGVGCEEEGVQLLEGVGDWLTWLLALLARSNLKLRGG